MSLKHLVPFNLRWQLTASRKYDGRYGAPMGFVKDGRDWGFLMEDGSFHYVGERTGRALAQIARVVFWVFVFIRGSF
jgi:hypothetical protein